MDWYIYAIVFAFIVVMGFAIGVIYVSNEIKKELRSDISETQMTKLEDNLSKFLSENHLNTESSLDEISTVLKVGKGEEADILTQAELSEPDKNGRRIATFRFGLNEQEKVFAFAHECGHLINGDTGHHTRPEGKNKPDIDQLADYTAAAILLPKEKISSFLEENNYKDSNKNKKMSLIKQLCKKYNVEDVLVIRRIREIYAMNQ